MRRSSQRLAVLACHGCCCQGWVPGTSPSITSTPASELVTIERGRQRFWEATTVVALRSARNKRTLRRSPTWLNSKKHDGSWDPGNQKDRPPLRLNMDDGPLPEYLMDMLRKDGIVDADGKPLQEEEVVHPYDDEDVYGTGSDRQRDADAADTEDDYFDFPRGDMFENQGKLNPADDYGLMGSTINEVALSYGFPVEFFLDVLTRWGVAPPIDQDVRLGDFVNAEQAFALGEALTGLDAADVRDNYLDERIEDLAVELDMPLPDLLQACAASKINLPQGADTHITIEEYKLLLDAVTGEGASSTARRLFDDNRMRHRWLGQQELAARMEAQSAGADAGGGRFTAPSWKDGPPVVGMGENELHPDDVHITGRIFGEEYFKLGGRGGDDDEGLFDFDEEDEDFAFGA